MPKKPSTKIPVPTFGPTAPKDGGAPPKPPQAPPPPGWGLDQMPPPPGTEPPGPKLPKKVKDRIDFLTAFVNINVPGVSSAMIRQLVKTGMKAGLEARDVLRFVQSQAFGGIGNVEEGTLPAILNAFEANPQTLVSAIRLREAMRKAGAFNREEGGPTAGIAGFGSFANQLYELEPSLKEAYLTSIGKKLVDLNGDGVMDAVVDINPDAEAEPVVDEEATTQFAPMAEDFLEGFEPQPVINETVQKLLTARARREGARYYGDTFTYEELLGEMQ